mmetsp:Transcript_42293/g.72859  ORF Transcript_42293/g.72859 Transcript_42293/m.72859 type:complete len:241 (-) Transcript_42293:1194-1916(-)
MACISDIFYFFSPPPPPFSMASAASSPSTFSVTVPSASVTVNKSSTKGCSSPPSAATVPSLPSSTFSPSRMLSITLLFPTVFRRAAAAAGSQAPSTLAPSARTRTKGPARSPPAQSLSSTAPTVPPQAVPAAWRTVKGPSALSFSQVPSQRVPAASVMTPGPWRTPVEKAPARDVPSASTLTAKPAKPSAYWPRYLPPCAQVSTPTPTPRPSRHSPAYRAPVAMCSAPCPWRKPWVYWPS